MRGFNPVAALQQLLERCRVFVDGATEGTGFFVAPGFVLTNAHVAGGEAGPPAQVHWCGQEYQAVVRAASADSPERGGLLYAFPDLAIVELLEPPDSHPCVWLDMTWPSPGAPLAATGYTDTLRLGSPAPRLVTLTAGGRTHDPAGPLLELVAGEIPPGHSGGPVLDLTSGAVCAVVKATRLEDSDMGGYAVTVDALRLLDPEVYRTVIDAHDRFHQDDRRWRDLSDQVERVHDDEAPQYRADDRRFLSLLSALPKSRDAVGSHAAAFLKAAPPGTPLPERPLLTHHDVYTELTARTDPPAGELPYEIAFCADLARELSRPPAAMDGAAGELRDQVLVVAGRIGLADKTRERLADTGAPARRPSVIGRVRHSLRDRSLYHVMVWRFRSEHDIVPGAPETSALPLDEALARLAGLLAAQIDLMGDTPRNRGLIELILPREVVDVDFAAWRLWPDFDFWSLGGKYDLVVRPLERHETPRLHAVWEERWRRLEGRRVGEALVCVCGRDRQRQGALDATFDLDPALAALALAGAPSRPPVGDAYTVALTSGVPMMVWRRDSTPDASVCDSPCGIPGRDACPRPDFLARARESLADTTRDDVPGRIRRLRNEAQQDPEDGDHIGGRVVVLWDDPSRRIPRTALVPAAPVEEGQTR
ncbi:trypsin-like peptidase domain-containing protein [Streptomyces mangrovisoli]|uniref:vWA-MoxR associated protein C-terminal domain-containing protein n=1 Tax=Streptomyces mangrovisoli TaxID=1428628 RepID=A0A1J4NQS5_9ACTN|nr:trypsin-like peptidase domain-containing protein [Streptomyces mangrovisoli]OIJ63597.1 hypothetical protein WN71_032755 [Streptomyces mangrovisoli]